MTKNRSLRLPDELDTLLRVEAAYTGMSVHGLILAVLESTAEDRRAATALREQTAMQKRMSEGWQKIPEHEHPQLTSEPDDPPLDTQGVPADSPKGKASNRPSRVGGGMLRVKHPTPGGESIPLAEPAVEAADPPAKGRGKPSLGPQDVGRSPFGLYSTGKPTCTCGPGEKAKGKHNRHCPAKGA